MGWRSRYSEKVKRSSVQKYQQEKRARLVSHEMGVSQPSLNRWFDDYANRGQDPTLQNLRVYQKINRTKPSSKKPGK
jgi:transposase-like protein